MNLNIDDLRPKSLREPHTLGTAMERIEDLVVGALAVRTAADDTNVTDDAASAKLNAWYALTANELASIFASSAPVLSFTSSLSDLPIASMRGRVHTNLRALSRGLLRIQERLVDDRERIAVAVSELATRVAQHTELVTLIRDTNSMTEDVWLKVVGDPIVNPPANRLLNLGVTQNAIWDVLKIAFGVVLAAT